MDRVFVFATFRSRSQRNRPRAAVMAVKLQKLVFFTVSQDVVMSFRVASLALYDIRRVSEGMCVHNRRGSKVAVSTGEAAKRRLFQGVTRSCDVVSHGRRVTL